MGIENLAVLKCNIKVGSFDVLFRSETLEKEEQIRLEHSINQVSYDLKQKTVTISIFQFNHPDFYRVLTNILADTNITILLHGSDLGLEMVKTTEYSKVSYPHLKFTAGEAIKHKHTFINRQKNFAEHFITYQFKKVEQIRESINNF